MAVFRIDKNKGYTCMSNYHFRDKRLSWKAKGILSNMLSLPDDWDYSLAGLTTLASDGNSATRTALKELEQLGYLVRRPIRKDGKIADWEYLIYEYPIEEKLVVENQKIENQYVEKPPQLNTNKSTTNESNTKKQKERKNNSFDEIIASYTSDEKTTELLQEWLKVRKVKRAAMTDRAIQMNIAKLDRLAKESRMTVCGYLEEIICRGWAAFYPINNFQNGNSSKKHVGENGIAIANSNIADEDKLPF